MSVHEQILVDAHKLEADGIVELFRFALIPSGEVNLKANNTVTWRGKTYEGWGIALGGVANSSDEEATRPQLVLANPEGIITALVLENQLTGALITRFRVLKDDLDNNRNRFVRHIFKIYRTVSITKEMAVFECRNILDSPFSRIPARVYIPPDFPSVSLA